ncbi:MAG: UDP-N-acetylmuramoyl-L-alanyl-D-glutamate--2,6-diaminopimelate ligase [Pseudomonadota bacterium]
MSPKTPGDGNLASSKPAAGKTLEALGLDRLLRLGPPVPADLRIASLAVDSRRSGPGALFAALRGVAQDGGAFTESAIAQGAVAVLCDLQSAVLARETLGAWSVPFLVAENPRKALAEAAARFYRAQPSVTAAVTGTNGKTSVATFTRRIWAHLGRPAANFGTTGVFAENLPTGPLERGLSHTTPEPVSLHALLMELESLGVSHAAMEASSHGLAQHRLDGVRLAAAAFTNLTRDHYDYHRTPQEYAAAKLRLFAEALDADGVAVANADDPLFPAIEQIARARGIRLIGYGRDADESGLKLVAQDAHLGGQTLRIAHGGRRHIVELSVVGQFQGWNALAAAGLALGTGETAEDAIGAIGALTGVPGRMELAARRANGAGVFVDYAHTPDALRTALEALRAHTPGRLHVVFGAGGDRDPGKRPLMGRAAAESADRLVVTDDNPRSEDPGKIRVQVIAGALQVAEFSDRTGVAEVGDRAEAILRGVDGLEPGDALLIAGKGHESGQEVAGETLPFDDVEQARAAVAALDGPEALES